MTVIKLTFYKCVIFGLGWIASKIRILRNVVFNMENFKESKSSKSSVWYHFLKSSDSRNRKAKCKHCDKVLICSGSSTSAIRYHLTKTHGISLTGEKEAMEVQTNPVPSTSSSSKRNQEMDSSTSSRSRVDKEPGAVKNRMMTDYFDSENSMQMTETRMVTIDGLTFRVFINSVDLVQLFKKSGYILPKSANTIKKIVIEECEKARIIVSKKLAELKTKGYKFSMTADEWTSTRNRRYININLHSPFLETTQKYVSLGLARIVGSATAMKCSTIIEERLKKFNLDFEDVTGLTTDGASVMVKMGKGLPVYHQLCFAHALQLAILDVLYKTDETLVLYEDVNDNHSDDDEMESESEDNGISIVPRNHQYQSKEPADYRIYKPLIEKIRKVVKIFRKSPTKNDEILQKYVIKEFGKDICLTIDCKTRWSSLCTMIGRFIMLYPSIQKVLIDLKSSIRFDDDELALMKHIHEVLEIVKSVVEVLCQEDATLLTADTALKHMFLKLGNIPGHLSAKLLLALRKRIGDRYLLIQGVLKYLHSPNDFFNESRELEHIFVKPTSDIITAVVKAMVTETSPNQTIPETTGENEEPTPSLPELKFKNFKEELVHKLTSVSSQSLPSSSTTSTSYEPVVGEDQKDECVPQMIFLEMAIHENGGQRGKYLSKAYQQLITVKPTSVESERAFSTAGYFCSKLRSRLNDSTLDALMFMRSYILSKKNSNK